MARSSQSNNNTEDEISIKELILHIKDWGRYLKSKLFIIGLLTLIGGFIGVLYSYFQKPAYVASTTFVLEDSGVESGLGNLGGIASMVGVDVGAGNGLFQGDNILELYKSRTMIEKTLLSPVLKSGKLLIDYYIEFKGLKKNWRPDLHNINFQSKTSDLEQVRLRDSVIGVIVKDISSNHLEASKLDEKLSIFRIVVTSESEFFAKTFNEQIVENVNDFYIQTKTKKSLKNISILTQKVDSVRSEIKGAVYSAAIIGDETPNINPTRMSKRNAPIQLSRISAEANSAILSELLKNLELTKMTFLREEPLIQIVDKPVMPLDKKELGSIKAFVIAAILSGFVLVLYFSVKWQYLKLMKEQV